MYRLTCFISCSCLSSSKVFTALVALFTVMKGRWYSTDDCCIRNRRFSTETWLTWPTPSAAKEVNGAYETLLLRTIELASLLPVPLSSPRGKRPFTSSSNCQSASIHGWLCTSHWQWTPLSSTSHMTSLTCTTTNKTWRYRLVSMPRIPRRPSSRKLTVASTK